MSTAETVSETSPHAVLASTERPSAHGRGRAAAALALWAFLTLLVSAGAGLVWAWLAEPAQWVVTDTGGLLLSEQSSMAQIGVELLYVALGIGVSVVAAALGTWRLRSLGWVVVPVAGVSALLGALLAWRVGILAGPAGTDNISAPVAPGDSVEAALSVDSWGSFLVWPVAALVAVVIVVWLTDRPVRHVATAAESGLSAPGEPAPHP